ncbi:EF-P 5-aminopentanol modification-associated protein YfmF [Liquorilactobacillus cacaonum]|uniref:EF-P 5-aminopentanol modification-associated protein YfmF n=1 Tax=Liquorilactobacillus cacaonum TaxID=483012 RepID=UPI00070A60E2|nr:pitrilysin family protein [Liquorilactobacillus cacaonum]
MHISLKPGVNLSVVKTKQFKTTRIAVDFVAPLKSEALTKRLLLASILENSSQKYSSQKILTEKLAQMYGAGFGVSTERKGNLHALSFNLECVNENFLGTTENLLDQGVNFLREIIFKPLIDKNKFDTQVFERQKEILADYIDSVRDDRQLFASIELNKLFFEDKAQSMPSFGSIDELEKITNEDLYSYYLDSIKNDQIEIIVVGDITDDQAKKIAFDFEFAKRVPPKIELFYIQKGTDREKKGIDYLDVSQAKLNLGYSLPVFFQDNEYYAALIFNDIFGGQPLSKLFINVREKASLAYYASSSYDSFRGFLTVKTGIKAKNKEKVLGIIDAQLGELKKGMITELEIETAKKGLKNSYLSQLDHQSVVLNRALFNSLLGKSFSEQEWMEKLNEVTIYDVTQIARKVHLEASYFLDGELKNENN